MLSSTTTFGGAVLLMFGCNVILAQEADRLHVDTDRLSIVRRDVEETFGIDVNTEVDPKALKDSVAEVTSTANQTDDATQRFVLLVTAGELSIQAADGKTFESVLSRLLRTYDIGSAVSVGSLYIDGLKSLKIAHTGLYAKAVVLQSISEEEFELAKNIVREFRKHARTKTENDTYSALVEFVTMATAKHEEYSRSDTNMPNAVGEYVCFTKGRWREGLPLVAEGKETPIQKAAMLDIAGKKPFVIADTWWEIGRAREGKIEKEIIQERAKYWYAKAIPTLPELGLNAMKAKKRLGKRKLTAPIRNEREILTSLFSNHRKYFHSAKNAVEETDPGGSDVKYWTPTKNRRGGEVVYRFSLAFPIKEASLRLQTNSFRPSAVVEVEISPDGNSWKRILRNDGQVLIDADYSNDVITTYVSGSREVFVKVRMSSNLFSQFMRSDGPAKPTIHFHAIGNP